MSEQRSQYDLQEMYDAWRMTISAPNAFECWRAGYLAAQHAPAEPDAPKQYADTETGWVNVSERLPHENGAYLVWSRHCTIAYPMNFDKNRNEWRHIQHAEGNTPEFNDPYNPVTHWRELPAKPEPAVSGGVTRPRWTHIFDIKGTPYVRRSEAETALTQQEELASIRLTIIETQYDSRGGPIPRTRRAQGSVQEVRAVSIIVSSLFQCESRVCMRV